MEGHTQPLTPHSEAGAAQGGPDPGSALRGPPHLHATSPGPWRDSGAGAQESLTSCSFPSTWAAGTHRRLDQSQTRGPGRPQKWLGLTVRRTRALLGGPRSLTWPSAPHPWVPGRVSVGEGCHPRGMDSEILSVGWGRGLVGAELGKLRP